MKLIKLLILFVAIIGTNPSNTLAKDCSKLDKISKEYAECNANLLKIEDSKKKFNKSNIKEKLFKFKNSKSHKEFIEN